MPLTSKFLQELLTRVPEANRAAVEAALEASPDAQKFADDGAKRQSDYSREMDALRQSRQQIDDFHAQQQAWYDQNKPLLEAGRQALAKAGDDPDHLQTPQLPADVLRRDDFERDLAKREQGAVAFMAATTTLAQRHYQRFGETLDVEALVKDPEATKLGLQGVYRKHYGERIDTQEAEKRASDLEAEVQRRLAEERAKQRIPPPYPVAGVEVSPLDALAGDKSDPSQYSADAAADEYLRLAAARG